MRDQLEGDALRELDQEVSFLTHAVKRNGRLALFDATKITKAIESAARETGEFSEKIAADLSRRVVSLLIASGSSSPAVETIQDLVEEVLLNSPFKRTAKAYILYRERHAGLRDLGEKIQSDIVATYLREEDWRVKENSNMSFSLQGLNQFISSEVSKVYWLRNIYPENIRQAHLDGVLHIHDLGLVGAYCVGWDLADLLRSGFCGVPGKIESRPPRHLRSALGQMVNFLYTLQGEAAGAQAFSNVDTLLAPFIRFDNLGYEEVLQCLQEFIFNLNIPTRVGFQTPFTNLTMDLLPPSYLRDTAVIVGGTPQELSYGDFQHEMDLFNRAFLQVMQQGDARGRVFTFPIPTYNVTPDFDWDSPLLEGLWKVTGKYGVPYFANFVNSDMHPDDARSMCCRLRLDNRELRRRGGGLFGSTPLTGSIGVVTLNLPRLGYLSKDEEEFRRKLREVLTLAVESLEVKRTLVEKFTARRLYPYAAHYLREVKERLGSYWSNHFSTIGVVGMNESALNLLGVSIATRQGKTFAEETLKFLREEILKEQERTGNLFNLEATPAEGVCYRLARLDQQLFSDCSFANQQAVTGGSVPFYTNSTHLPVDATPDLYVALQHQDQLQQLYTGGTVFHAFVGEEVEDTQAVKELIKALVSTTAIPYFTLTPTFSVCPACGYLSGASETCPQCERECEVYSRVVGYLRPVTQWNRGKQAEFDMREEYTPCA